MGRLMLTFLLLLVPSSSSSSSSPSFASAASANTIKKISVQLSLSGEKALEIKNYQQAKKLCEQAMVADPANPSGFACLGRSLAKLGQGKSAQRYYKIALTMDPNHKKALIWGALRDLAIGRSDKAQKKLVQLEKICKKCELSQKLRAAYLNYKAKRNAAKRANK